MSATTMSGLSTAALLWIFLGAGLAKAQVQEPAKLASNPQKLVTFYAFDDAQVPAAVRGVGQGALPVKASDGAAWSGSSQGLVRRQPAARIPGDRVQYFSGRRYLPDDEVQGIVPDNSGGVWVRTQTGISHIAMVRMSLEKKAAYFEERVKMRHDRYGLVASSTLRTPGDLSTNQLDPSDNDGLWTAMYAAGECFRYAVTRSAEALARARRSVEAVLFLEEVTGRPGYPARSYIRKGDRRGAGGTWVWTADGEKEWKADTSSDEIVGHYYIFGIAYDLLPDAGLKRKVAAVTSRMTDHIIGNGYNLTCIHGQPTYWGRWSKEYFGTRRGKGDGPLNAVELLSFLKTAHHITGDARYEQEYRKVANELDYTGLALKLKELREEINYSDEELAMLPFYLLFRYEKDPKLLSIYRAALEQWWENMERERNPLWTFIYQVANPSKKADLGAAVYTLNRIPMDLRTWSVNNSYRTDMEWEGKPDRFGRRQTRTWLAPDERPVMKWNGNPFQVNGGNGGRSEDDGAFFLLPYWMGRYHNLIQ